MKPSLMTALHRHAEQQIPGMVETLDDLIGDGELVVGGFVFRPADDEDIGEGHEDEADQYSWWVLECFFVPTGADTVCASLSNRSLISFEPGMSYTDACAKLGGILAKV